MCIVVTEIQAEGSAIPEAIAVETATKEVEIAVPVAGVTERAVPVPEALVAPEIIIGVHVDVLLESSTDVVVRSPEIQDEEPIRSAPMAEATPASRDRLELLADELVDPTIVARNPEMMHRTEQWMKVCYSTLSSRVS
jgi:hypothetical protein